MESVGIVLSVEYTEKYVVDYFHKKAKEILRQHSNIYIDGITIEVQSIPKQRKKLLAFRWYGGKLSHIDWIIPLLPKSKHYCEPFGGSAAILLNKEPSEVETYNDIDGEVVNFFRVLRDKTEELIRKLYLTPFSREEFRKAITPPEDTDNVTRALYFFIRAEQVRIGLAQKATEGRWAYCKLTSRRGKAGAISRWQNRINALWLIAKRLRDVQIENDNALNVIERYDSSETLFYCDPPYVHSARRDTNAYRYEMTDKDHIKLAELLNEVKGKVALSGYDDPLMQRLYKNWIMIKTPPLTIHSSKARRRECLWINYEPNKDVIENLRRKGFEIYEP